MTDSAPTLPPEGGILLTQASLDRLIREVARIADCLDQIRLQEHGLRQETKGPSTTVERDLPVNISTSPQAGSVNAELDANDLTWKSTGFFHANLRADSGFNFREEGRLACRVLQEAPNLEQGLTRMLRLGWRCGRADLLTLVPGGWAGSLESVEGLRPGTAATPLLLLPPGGGGEFAVRIEDAAPGAMGAPWKATGLRVDHGTPSLTYLTINLEQE